METQFEDEKNGSKVIGLLRRFLAVQQHRALAYARLKRFRESTGHECVHIQQITEASGTEEAEADSQYDNALKEAIKGIQDAVISINEYFEEIRYGIAALETE